MNIDNWIRSIFSKIKRQGKKDQKPTTTNGDKDAISTK